MLLSKSGAPLLYSPTYSPDEPGQQKTLALLVPGLLETQAVGPASRILRPLWNRLCQAQSRDPHSQAGLLTHGSSLCRRLPVPSGTVALMSASSPFTVALPRRTYTAFPIKPRRYLECAFQLLSYSTNKILTPIHTTVKLITWRRQYGIA